MTDGRGPDDIELYIGEQSPCPYLDGRLSRHIFTPTARLEAGTQEAMTGSGWRRSGTVLYRTICPECGACIPLRIDVRNPSGGGRRKRAAARNRDIIAAPTPARFEEEHFALYARYMEFRHSQPSEGIDRQDYTATLLLHPRLRPTPEPLEDSPLIMEYRTADEGRLVALGWLDVYPRGYSSIYFAFDPAEARRSLGVYSVAVEAAAALAAGKHYYYLGFWVPGASTMDYKADYGPFELALPASSSATDNSRRWVHFEDRASARDFCSSPARREP